MLGGDRPPLLEWLLAWIDWRGDPHDQLDSRDHESVRTIGEGLRCTDHTQRRTPPRCRASLGGEVEAHLARVGWSGIATRSSHQGEEHHAANDGCLDGHALPSHQELSLRVFVKDAGVWQIAAFHNTMVAPFAPPLR
jgi:hypothetical protein